MTRDNEPFMSQVVLACAEIGNDVFTHEYDGIGNHTLWGDNAVTNEYAHNSLNQLTSSQRISVPSVAPCEMTYSSNGGLASDGTWLYAYDAEDRLVSVTSASLTNGALRVENAYDWRDRRISKTMSRYDSTDETWNIVERRVFTYDDWNLVHETIMQISGVTPITTEIQYFWGFDLSETLQGAGGVGGLLAVSINDSFYFPCYDNNGNVTKYVDETGAVAASYAYDDFGRVVSQSGPLADAFPHRFSTKHFDAETGLCYYGRRFYSPLLKRWLNRDPLMEDSSSNLYQPMQNSLFDTMDPDGALAIVILAGSRGNGRAFDKATKEMSDALRKNYEYSKIINEFPESKYNCLLEQRRVVFNGSIFEGDLTSFKGKVNRELKSLIRHCPKYAGSIAFLGDASIVATESYDYAAYAAHGGEGWANKKDTIIWYDDGLQDQKDVQNAVSKKLRKLKCKKPFVSCYKTWNGKGKRPLAAREFMNIITPRLIVGVDKLEYTPFKLKYGRMGGK